MPRDVIFSPEVKTVVGVEVARSRRSFFTMNVFGMAAERNWREKDKVASARSAHANSLLLVPWTAPGRV